MSKLGLQLAIKKKKCDNKGLKSLSVYKPVINVDPSAPFLGELTSNELKMDYASLKSAEDINLTDNSFVSLDRDQLITANDDYDYISLTSGEKKRDMEIMLQFQHINS